MIEKVTNIIKKISNKTVLNILIVLILILSIYLVFYLKNPPYVKETINENKLMQKKIDSILLNNDFIIFRMYEMEKKQSVFSNMINQNNELIKENNKELLKLKKIYDEKINSANNYNTSQLDSFFRNKYKDYYER
jgi:hypothetical protein